MEDPDWVPEKGKDASLGLVTFRAQKDPEEDRCKLSIFFKGDMKKSRRILGTNAYNYLLSQNLGSRGEGGDAEPVSSKRG